MQRLRGQHIASVADGESFRLLSFMWFSLCGLVCAVLVCYDLWGEMVHFMQAENIYNDEDADAPAADLES